MDTFFYITASILSYQLIMSILFWAMTDNQAKRVKSSMPPFMKFGFIAKIAEAIITYLKKK